MLKTEKRSLSRWMLILSLRRRKLRSLKRSRLEAEAVGGAVVVSIGRQLGPMWAPMRARSLLEAWAGAVKAGEPCLRTKRMRIAIKTRARVDDALLARNADWSLQMMKWQIRQNAANKLLPMSRCLM